MAKIDKKFILTDGSVNQFGFRINMAKLSLERFKSNPVMLYNHRGLVGRWEDLQITDGQLTGYPNFMDDEKEEEAILIANRVKNDYVKGASLGIHIIDIEMAPDGTPLVECEVLECSVVDIPNNANAIVLMSADGEPLKDQELQLSLNKIKQIKKSNNTEMKLNLKSLGALGLEEGASESAINNAIAKLSGKASKVEELQKKLNTLQTEQLEAQKKNAETLVEGAIKEGKITAEKKQKFVDLAIKDLELASDTLASLPGKSKLPSANREGVTADLNLEARKDWDFDKWRKEDPAGLINLKSNDPDAYQEILNK